MCLADEEVKDEAMDQPREHKEPCFCTLALKWPLHQCFRFSAELHCSITPTSQDLRILVIKPDAEDHEEDRLHHLI